MWRFLRPGQSGLSDSAEVKVFPLTASANRSPWKGRSADPVSLPTVNNEIEAIGG